MRIYTLLIGFLLCLALSTRVCGQIYPLPGEGTSVPDSIPAPDTDYPDLNLFYRQLAKNTYNETDSVRRRMLADVPLEKYMEEYARRGIRVLRDTASLFDFFDDDRTIFTIKERREVLMDQIAAITHQSNHPKFRLVTELFRAELISVARHEERMNAFEQVFGKYRKIGDTLMEAYILACMWEGSYFGQHWARSFNYARRLEEALDRVDDTYPLRGSQYIGLGLAYYSFKNYEKAIDLFHKGLALRDTSFILFSNNYLKAWNYLAVYHEMKGESDSAAVYHRTIMESPEGTAGVAAHAAIALCNLGRIEQEKGNIDAAVAMLQAGLDYMEVYHQDRTFITGIYTSLGECCLSGGDTAAAMEYYVRGRREVDAFPDIPRENRLKDLYALASDYYSHRGQPGLSKAYLDSALLASTRYEQLSGQHLVLRGEQELQETEAQLQKEQVARQRHIILIVFVVLVVLVIILLFVVRLYRRKNAAYTLLAARAIEWSGQRGFPIEMQPTVVSAPDDAANDPSCADTKEPPTSEELRVMALIEREMTENHAYLEPIMTVQLMADRLDIHRNLLSRAINKITGNNFNHYLNSYRIKEAVRLIHENDRRQLYINELYERVGFSHRASFYRAFKQFTGLTPIEFQQKRDAKPLHDNFNI